MKTYSTIAYNLSLFSLFQEYWIDTLESRVDLFSLLGSSQHDFTRYENQQHDLGCHHTIDQAGE